MKWGRGGSPCLLPTPLDSLTGCLGRDEDAAGGALKSKGSVVGTSKRSKAENQPRGFFRGAPVPLRTCTRGCRACTRRNTHERANNANSGGGRVRLVSPACLPMECRQFRRTRRPKRRESVNKELNVLSVFCFAFHARRIHWRPRVRREKPLNNVSEETEIYSRGLK